MRLYPGAWICLTEAMRSRLLFLLPLICTLLTNGCSKPKTRVEEGIKDRVLYLGNLSEPTDLDPQVITSQQDFYIVSSLFEGLVGHNPKDASPIPGVADHWEISADGLVYTFHLRPSAMWSNGYRLTADDFVKSYRRILSPGIASEYRYLHYVVTNAQAYAEGKLKDFSQVGYQAVDEHTLRITLREPTPYFLAMLSHPSWYPVPLATIEKFGGADKRGTDWTKPGNFVGNGPFTLGDWKVHDVVTVVKNDGYWDRVHVSLQAINFYPIESADTEERAFRSGQLDVTATIPSAKLDTYRKEHPDQLQQSPFFGTYFLRFNTHVKPLDDARVRRALAMSIDRDAIVKAILRGGQLPAFSLIPPNLPDYKGSPGFTNNPTQARQLLADAGYPGGKGFPKLEYLFNTNEAHKQIAEALQQMWKRELNIDITLVNQEAKVYEATMAAGNYQIARYAWVGDYLDPSTFLDMMTSASGNNQTGWSSSQYDQAVERSDHEMDATKRVGEIAEAESLLMKDMPICPIYFYTRDYLKQPFVKGWLPNLLDIHPYKFVWLEEDD